MNLQAFIILDRITGLYQQPFFRLKEELAKRDFVKFTQNPELVATDYELYFIGTFSPETGSLEVHTPVFMLKGSEDLNA